MDNAKQSPMSPKDSIATRLLRIIFGIYLTIAIIVTVIQLGIEYFNVKKDVIEEVKSLHISFYSSLNEALWKFDGDQLKTLLKGIWENQVIVGVRIDNHQQDGNMEILGWVIDVEGHYHLVGQENKEFLHIMEGERFFTFIEYEFPFTYIDEYHNEYDLGKGIFYSSNQVVFNRIKYGFMLIIINSVVKTLALWIIFLVVVRRFLIHPLVDLTQHVAHIDPENVEHVDFSITTIGRNELKILEEVFHHLIQNLVSVRKKLEHYNLRLEDLVEKRTVELKETNEELQRATQQAKSANRAKSQFLANMSHELRTPLNAILGFAQIISYTPQLPPETQDNLAIIQRSGTHLLTLINQVLDFSKIEAGHITVNEKSFDLFHLLHEVHDMFSLRTRQKGLSLSVDVAPDVPRYVRTDDVKLRQILINVLNNAMNFTQEGGVTVRVKAQREEGNDEGEKTNIEGQKELPIHLLFEIEDTGVGIAPEEMDTLFEAFAQTESGRQAQEGTGLGLPISRKFIQLMGGDITATSDIGHGTTFRFTIHITSIDNTDIEKTHPSRHAVALEPGQPCYRLLIVDDKPDNRALLVKLLNPFGFELREATNGQEAVVLWNAWKPHLIWMDLRMPVMGGYDATKRIRNDELSMKHEFIEDSKHQTPNTTIIALSASTLDDERTTALANGCDDFLRKPFLEADIFDLIQKHLGVRFVYESSQREAGNREQVIEQERLTIETLAALPADLLVRLKHAVTACEMDAIAQVIAEIRAHDSSLADALTGFAEDFDYASILTSIRESQSSPLTPQALAQLPETWYQQLKWGSETLDVVTMNKILMEIRQQNPQLANELAKLVTEYRFDRLQELFQQAETDR